MGVEEGEGLSMQTGTRHIGLCYVPLNLTYREHRSSTGHCVPLGPALQGICRRGASDKRQSALGPVTSTYVPTPTGKPEFLEVQGGTSLCRVLKDAHRECLVYCVWGMYPTSQTAQGGSGTPHPHSPEPDVQRDQPQVTPERGWAGFVSLCQGSQDLSFPVL